MSVSPPVAAWLLSKNRRRRISASLSVAATPVTTAAVGVAYAGFSASATGGQGGAYAYTIASGGLPPGLSIDRWTGAVSGTPTDDGAFTAAIRASDEVGNFIDTAPFTITVTA